MPRVTEELQLIAEAVGVSLSTVYRVLNGDIKGQRADNRARSAEIRRLAADMGYRTFSQKPGAHGRPATAALVFSPEEGRSFIHHGAFLGIQEELEHLRMHLAVARLADSQLSAPDGAPRFLRERMCAGLLINYGEDVPVELQRLVRRQRLPVVWLNANLEVDAVALDDQQGAVIATEHLLRLGHRRIAYVDYHRAGHYSVMARRSGYLRAMQAADLAPQFIHPEDDVPPSDRYQFTRAWLARPDRPTATVGYGPEEALNVATGALANGLRIPEDLSIVALHERPLDATGIVFTTAFADTQELGRCAVRMLVEKIAHPRAPLPSASFHYQLTAGQSSQAP